MAFVAGQKLRVSDLSGGTTGGTGSTGNGSFDRMTADVTVNNSTTLTDSGLAIDVLANAVYEFHAWLRYTGGNTPDLKIALTTPAGTTGFWSLVGNGKDAAPATDTGVGATFNATDIGTSLTVAGDATGTLQLAAFVDGSLATSSTAGTLKIRVAQRTATASNTVLKTFSYLRVTRID